MEKKEIEKELKKIRDPELNVDIVTLGLIREITVKDEGVKSVHILMTLTSPFCPFVNQFIEEIEDTLEKMGFEDVAVDLTFDPPWTPPEGLDKLLHA